METNCPLCSRALDVRKVAPCFDCGHSEDALIDLEVGFHDYHTYSVFDREVVLCDRCAEGFDSYRPEYFGADAQDYEVVRGRRLMAPKAQLDGVCGHCRHRVAFVEFLIAARAFHEA